MTHDSSNEAQNVYDNPTFFNAYRQLRRSVHGLDGAPEWPALRDLLPDLSGKRVLDLGCGLGWFSVWAREQGARSVLALDISERMLEGARERSADPAIRYERADLDHLVVEQLAIEDGPFDLAYSSLAFHYISDLDRLAAVIHAALRPGARLVCSVEHPIYTAPRQQEWIGGSDGHNVWPLRTYQDEGVRDAVWLGTTVRKYHRTVGTLLNTFIRQGFVVEHVEDWGPTAEQLAAQPDLATELDRPTFLLLAAHREDSEGA